MKTDYEQTEREKSEENLEYLRICDIQKIMFMCGFGASKEQAMMIANAINLYQDRGDLITIRDISVCQADAHIFIEKMENNDK